MAGVAAVIIIALTSRLGPRWNVAAPLLLLLAGLVVSFLPFMPDIEIEPEIILAVVLPPLLFSSAVNMPAMNFRREFNSIGGLAVTLVIVSSILLGLFFHLIFPALDLAWCIALGAILSPTDAVATSIAKGSGISSRVTTILDGESLLNDATALVTLRTAVAAAASAFSLWHAVGQFAWSVVIAIVIGVIAGKVGVWARKTSGDPTVSTVISIIVPFVASVPTDMLHGSGLVAAVVAGIVTGRAKNRVFRADQRVSDRDMWKAVTLLLEGGVFLLMGLEVRGLIHEHTAEEGAVPLWGIVVIALGALILMTLIRAAFILPLIRKLGRSATKAQEQRPRLEAMESAIADRDLRRAKELTPNNLHMVKKRVKKSIARGVRRASGNTDPLAAPSQEVMETAWKRFERRTRKVLSDIDYYTKQPLTMRDGVIMVVAGMRGAVTLAAAQTLPHDTPYRSTLVLIAFTVAVLSLGIQGGTLPAVVRLVKPSVPDPADVRRQRQGLSEALNEVSVEPRPGETMVDTKLRIIGARRDVLLDLEDEGYYDPECTGAIMASMDASELGLRLRQVQEGDLLEDEDLATREAVQTLSAEIADDWTTEQQPEAGDRREVLSQAEEATRRAADPADGDIPTEAELEQELDVELANDLDDELQLESDQMAASLDRAAAQVQREAREGRTEA